jgi:hypothetical protein
MVLVLGLGAFVGIVIYKRMETGTWKMPTKQDVAKLAPKALPPVPEPPRLSRVIYLERNELTLTGGVDDAARSVSSVLASNGVPKATLPAFKGGNETWDWLVSCVRKKFEPFDVDVTDVRPTHADFAMVKVGGDAKLIGGDHKHAGGLAPFNSQVIPRAVVFAFSESLRNRKREMCEVIGMEVAHAYGLDHGYHCLDLMTYLPNCGVRRFQDKDVPCGEKSKRVCANGEATQNSYRHLMKVFGPAKPPVPAAAPSKE